MIPAEEGDGEHEVGSTGDGIGDCIMYDFVHLLHQLSLKRTLRLCTITGVQRDPDIAVKQAEYELQEGAKQVVCRHEVVYGHCRHDQRSDTRKRDSQTPQVDLRVRLVTSPL